MRIPAQFSVRLGVSLLYASSVEVKHFVLLTSQKSKQVDCDLLSEFARCEFLSL